MLTLVYDGSFEGFLTAVFDVYDRKINEVEITVAEKLMPSIFGELINVDTDETKYERVIKGLRKKISLLAFRQLYAAFLSEANSVENNLLKYIQYVFSSKLYVETDYSNSAVLFVKETAKKVNREKHRMEAFIRFQLTKDGIYYAICQPDFNVLPLIENHFVKRYADQRWLIYDALRKYGLYYNLEKVEIIQMTFDEQNQSGKDISNIYDENEKLFQELWKHYFTSVNIIARKNTKLHVQHMPKRYWKYLPEKSVDR